MKETVEQYLARGGKIQTIPRGQGKEQIRLVRNGSSKERAVYVTGKTSNYNGAAKPQE
jgi:hypothetical protein